MSATVSPAPGTTLVQQLNLLGARIRCRWPALGVIALTILVLAARWQTRSTYLFDLDSILYARALDNFDLRLSQPPLPGYFLYVQLGRLARLVMGDANLALVMVSTVLGLLLVGALALLARELFDDTTAVIAALLALTAPIYWYQSSFASPRIAEGFFAALIVWLGVRVRRHGDRRAFWALTVTLAVAGGIRQQTLLYLIPFSIWATWSVAPRLRLLGATLCGLLVLMWLLPTLQAAGGLDGYRALSDAQFQAFVVNQTGVLQARTPDEMLRRLATNVSFIILYAGFTCLAGLPLLLLPFRHPSRLAAGVRSLGGQALLLATLPPLGFFALVHIQQIGHALAIAPFLTLAEAYIVRHLPWPQWRWPFVSLLVIANLAFLAFAPARLVGEQVGTPSVSTIKERNTFVAAAIASIRAFSPEETLVLTSPLSYGFIETYAPVSRYLLLPGLFDRRSDASRSRDTRVLTNGLVPATDLEIQGSGRIRLPGSVRRVVMVGYERNMAAMLDPTVQRITPDARVPSLVIVELSGAVELSFAPGQLLISPIGDRS